MELSCLHCRTCPKKATIERGKFFVPFTPTHPDLPLALGHKPGRLCELSLVLGKGLGPAADLVSLAKAARRGQR